MIVFLLEAGVVMLMLQGIRWRAIVKGTALVILLILLFGYIGDLRSGADSFRVLAQPSANYPQWLPSGVLWVYIYLTTPIGNLVNTVDNVRPTWNALFPNTTSLLFPSVLRRMIYGTDGASEAFSGELITDAFNVSTAYAGSAQDFGKIGIALFSAFCGFCGICCWHLRTFCGALMYGVVAQCIVLTVFFNHLLYLPVVFQVVWLLLFCSRHRFTIF